MENCNGFILQVGKPWGHPKESRAYVSPISQRRNIDVGQREMSVRREGMPEVDEAFKVEALLEVD